MVDRRQHWEAVYRSKAAGDVSWFQPHAVSSLRVIERSAGPDAHILDVGGESSRPGALSVSIDEELRRVMPVVEAMRGRDVPVSVDTCKAEVMRAAIESGAAMINAIDALQNEGALAAVAGSNVAVCLMHKQGAPQTMQLAPSYDDVVAEVMAFLQARVAAAEAAGISRARLVIDPGFGFGKTLLLGALIGPMSNLGYTVMAVVGLSTPVFGGVLFVENFSEGFAGAALVAYMASLTSIGYTATQYALLSSFYALLGKFLKGLSGVAVEGLEQGRPLMEAYALFFAATAAVGVPAVLLCWILLRRQRPQAETSATP